MAKAVFRLSCNFRERVAWNKDGAEGFVSLDAQSGPVNALHREGGFPVPPPGETETFTGSVTRPMA